MTGRAYRKSAEIAAPHGPVRRLPAERGGDARRDREAPRRRRQHRARRLGAGRPALGVRAGVGRRARPRRGARLPQRAGDRARADRDDQLHDGLRHDRASSPTSRSSSRRSSSAAARSRSSTRRCRWRSRSSATRRARSSEIVAFIDERNTIVGAPYVKTEHYPVFDCAIGDRAIHYMGHVKMMGAVQPFISGAISKTVNLPEQATVDEVAQLFIDAWQLGVKAIAIYRDNCKVAQPLSGKSATDAAAGARRRRRRRSRSAAACPTTAPRSAASSGRRVRGLHPRRPVRGRHARRHLRRHREGGHDPRRPDELVHDLGLARPPVRRAARGLRLEVLPHALRAVAASTNDADIRIAKSIVDYIFRWMGKKFLDRRPAGGGRDPHARGEARRIAERYANGERRPPSRAAGSSRPRRARRRSSTPGRTRSSARTAAAAWSGPALLHVPRLRHEHRLLIVVAALCSRPARER